MQMANVTNAQNSEIGSGQKNTDFLGLKALFRWLGGRNRKPKETIRIEETLDGFWVIEDRGYGATYCGPYKREQDAKGVRTRLIKQHA